RMIRVVLEDAAGPAPVLLVDGDVQQVDAKRETLDLEESVKLDGHAQVRSFAVSRAANVGGLYLPVLVRGYLYLFGGGELHGWTLDEGDGALKFAGHDVDAEVEGEGDTKVGTDGYVAVRF